MNKHIRVFFALVAGSCLLASCLNSDDDSSLTYSNDTAITEFSLLTVNRYIHTVSKSGGDSVYKKSLSVPVSFHIDQYQRKIYNTDSLANDCDLSHVLISVSSRNSGTVLLKSVVGDTVKTFTTTDSLDFSQPRTLVVYSPDGTSYRTYDVTMNKHQATVGQLVWTKADAADFPTDANTAKWEQAVADAGLKSFVGAGTKHAYAFSHDGQLMVYSEKNPVWTPDSLDEDSSLLPTLMSDFVSWNFEATDSTDCQLLVGVSKADSRHCVVWRKLAEYASNSEAAKWTYIPIEVFNRYGLPVADYVSIVLLQGKVLAFSSDGNIYISRDQGITWKTYSAFKYPAEAYSAVVDAQVDEAGFVYIRNKENGEVWRGYYIE